jgi:hypothetical protein
MCTRREITTELKRKELHAPDYVHSWLNQFRSTDLKLIYSNTDQEPAQRRLL